MGKKKQQKQFDWKNGWEKMVSCLGKARIDSSEADGKAKNSGRPSPRARV